MTLFSSRFIFYNKDCEHNHILIMKNKFSIMIDKCT